MLVHHRQRPTTLECHTSQTRLPRLSLFTTRDGITRPADKLLDVLTPHWSLALGSSAGGKAGNTNRKGYSRRVVSGSSVNVIANPVRVAPIPKVIAHVPTNISITASGARL